MSNLGLERHLAGARPDARAHAGRRPLCARTHARSTAINLGGEQSGHIILSDYTTTGDGLVAALQVLAVVEAAEQAGVARSATASSRCRRC